MKKYLLTLLLLLPLVPFSQVPIPVSIKEKPGVFILDDQVQILINGRDADLKMVGSLMREQLQYTGGLRIKMREPDPEKKKIKAIILTYVTDKNKIPPEGYRMDITPNQIVIEGSTGAGVFYGFQTLMQLMLSDSTKMSHPEKQKSWEIACAQIVDYPRYPYRGMHLDVSRHFFPKEFIKKYIDLIAMYKMNRFHWHLTDDNGWRIEIRKYPKLTEIGAWRVDREHLPWGERPVQQPGENAAYGGFYTQDDIREIVAYAQARFVTIIPEIEMPAHSIEVLAAYPQFSCTGGPFTVLPGSYWPNSDILCAGNDSTFIFLQDVLTEVMELFPSAYIHAGGDEADKSEWKKCPKCQARMNTEGLKDEKELQSYFMKRMEKFIVSKGRKMIGWDEILEGGLAPEATVMSWRGVEGGIDAARQGHDAIMTPTSHCYFDYTQGDPSTELKAIGGAITLKKVYSFEPTPKELNADEAKHILGAQGNVWTEYIPDPAQVEFMALPRMIALAEVVWSPAEKRDWDDFSARLQDQLRRLDNMGVHYSKGTFRIGVSSDYSQKNQSLMISLSSEQYKIPIHYTLDGNDPTVKSPIYTDPFPVSKNAFLKAAHFEDGKIQGHITSNQLLYHLAIPAKIKLIQPYSYRYPGSGEQTVIDGFKGSVNHRDGFWQGYHGNDIEIILDLRKKQPIKSISSTYLLNPRSWIFLPEYVEYALSDDGKKWHSINEKYNPAGQRSEEAVIQPFGFGFPGTEARFIRVRAKNIGTCPDWHEGKGEKAWIFIDEISVY